MFKRVKSKYVGQFFTIILDLSQLEISVGCGHRVSSKRVPHGSY